MKEAISLAKAYEFWDYKNSKKKSNTRLRKIMYRAFKKKDRFIFKKRTLADIA